MKHRIVPRLTSMLAVWLVLLLWHLSAPHIGLPGNLAFLLLLAIPVWMSGAEAAFYRRHAFRREFLVESSWLHRMLGLAPVIVAIEAIKALLLSLMLMVGTVTLGVREWSLLLLDVFVLALLMPRLPGLLHDSVKSSYLYAISRRWAIWFSTLLLWLESVLVLWFGSSNDYRGLDWPEAVAYATNTGVSEAGLVATAERIVSGADGLATWASYSLLHGVGDPAQLLAAVLVLVAAVGGWFLLAWSYSRALVGVTARPFAVWWPRARQRAGGGAFETWWL